ncbi:MAG: late competence development ComFB family protein [Candidatus Marinimicrobia bacterium]|nr:late competence development ComFB family protein [Candidatus Neomarinimicrobiota bacterium]
MSGRTDLQLRLVDLSRIYNRNEKRVVPVMEKILTAMNWDPEDLDIQDIYALALNNLPPRYVQDGTIVFNESVREKEIERVVQEAVDKVKLSPNY